jgi:hypothetical protein
MKFARLSILVLLLLGSHAANAQRKPPASKPKAAAPVKSAEIGKTAMVIDETLSVLRKSPSLFAEPVQRMSRGRRVTIQGVVESDGIRFYKVTVPPANFGWVQADAVFGAFRPADEQRLAALAQAADGFDQIEIAHHFFEMFPDSKLRPALLLLYGDVLESAAATISKNAASRLSRKEMAASGAPLHTYYLNFNYLDRYRKIGIIFLFNPETKLYHYDGAAWKEIVAKFPSVAETTEAQKRIDVLKQKMASSKTIAPNTGSAKD